MRSSVVLLTLLVALAITAGSAATAGAASYCVHQPTDTCAALYPGPTIDEGADLQAALDAANATPEVDTVLVGPGTYVTTSAEGFTSHNNSDVSIVGAGIGRTVLSAGTHSATSVLQLLGTSASGVTGLTIEATPSLSGEALRVTGLTANATAGPVVNDIAVTNAGAASSALPGIEADAGASVNSSTVAGGANGNTNGAAITNLQGAISLADDTLTGTVGLAGENFSAQRLRIAAVTYALQAAPAASGSPSSSVNGVLATTSGPASSAVSDFDADLTVRSGTFVHSGQASAGPALTSSVGSAAAASSLTVKDSIALGYSSVFCGDGGSGGTADMTLGWDDIDLVSPGCAGPGMFSAGIGNIDADPRFVNPAAGDYHLLFNSPAIDAGEPGCNAPCAASDLDGLTRPIDGGSGNAVRDMGAYEYGNRPPTVTASASAVTVVAGTPVTFVASGADPDEDALTYQWQFDDGPFVGGASVTHVLPFTGTRTETVVVTDPTGHTATATVVVNVVAPSSPPLPPPPPDRTAPTISKLSLTHTTFAVSSSSTATSASVKSRKKPIPKGTTIHFTLSEAATVVVAISHHSAGVTVGGKCVTPSAKHRRGTRCDLAVGKITRKSEKQGADAISFSGRLGRKALARGSYTLSIVATDAAGNRSKARTASFTVR